MTERIIIQFIYALTLGGGDLVDYVILGSIGTRYLLIFMVGVDICVRVGDVWVRHNLNYGFCFFTCIQVLYGLICFMILFKIRDDPT